MADQPSVPRRFEVPSDPSYCYPLSDFPPQSEFEEKVCLKALVIPVRRTAELRRNLSTELLQRAKTKNVYAHVDKSKRILVLKYQSDEKHSDEICKFLAENEDVESTTYTLTSGYKDLSLEQVLKQLLPLSISEIPSAFEAAGHVAHVNLRQDLLPFKYIIGKALLDKNAPRIKTVVNKVGSIETQYRTFEMEILAGNSDKDWSLVQVREEGNVFDLNFEKVYWNSRLAWEHARLVKLIQKSPTHAVVADCMAGVGPFAVPLSKVCKVYANDLNPACFEYLKINAQQNKCEDMETYNMDARAFVHRMFKRDVHHFIMNLPATAPEFLDAFRGFEASRHQPTIHVYCFVTKGNVTSQNEEAMQRCSKALGCELNESKDEVKVYVVRDVSPTKFMVCISFVLPKQMCEMPKINLEEEATKEPDPKRLKS